MHESETNPAGADAGAGASPSLTPASTGTEQPAGFDVLCLSGRGDKDLAEVMERTGG